MASNLLHDSCRYQRYQELLEDTSIPPTSRINVLEIDLPKSPSHFQGPYAYSQDVSQLTQLSNSPIRVILAALDYPSTHTNLVLETLISLFDIPTAFLSERVQGVTHSLNVETSPAGGVTCWLHFLCKAIVKRPDAPTWHRAGFFLTHTPQNGTTLLCFGASKTLITRLQRLPFSAWQSIATDPLAILAIVLSDLQLIIDEQVWALNDRVGDYEHRAITTTRTMSAFPDDYFQELHLWAKNVIHLKEAADASLCTCQSLLDAIKNRSTLSFSGGSNTTATLAYLYTLMHSTTLRTASLHSRIQNTIALSFNLVAQTDSHSLRAESSSMHTIAITTLIFLPISTVATIFGSQFFSFNPPEDAATPADGGPEAASLVLSKEFWLFWVITVPLTVAVLGIWLGFHPEAVRRWWRRNIRKGKDRQREDEEGGGGVLMGIAVPAGGTALQNLSIQATGASGLSGSSTLEGGSKGPH